MLFNFAKKGFVVIEGGDEDEVRLEGGREGAWQRGACCKGERSSRAGGEGGPVVLRRAAAQVLMAATDAGADDIKPRAGGKKGWEVIAEASAFGAVQSALREAGFKVSGEESGLRMVPLAEVDVARLPPAPSPPPRPHSPSRPSLTRLGPPPVPPPPPPTRSAASARRPTSTTRGMRR